jgi:diguanylate cyclase (GGDEF)-like protein/PAS domain S-box-containing protein
MLEGVPGPRNARQVDGVKNMTPEDEWADVDSRTDVDFYREILDNQYDGVYFVDRQRKITYWNKGAERITGYPAERAVGTYCANGLLNHVDEAGNKLCGSRCPLLIVMREGVPKEAQVYLHHADGHRLPVLIRGMPLYRNGKIIGAVETFSDNSRLIEIRQRVNELTDVAVRDELTGVGNRRFADAQLHVALTQAKEQARLSADEQRGLRTGVLFIDLDHFKRINDNFGHLVGDQVLKMVTRTLTANLRTIDILARWGGEEFIAIISYIDANRLLAVAEHVRRLVANASLLTESGVVEVTISLGATLVREYDTKDTLIGRVDRLLYESKQTGRNKVSTDIEPVEQKKASEFPAASANRE